MSRLLRRHGGFCCALLSMGICLAVVAACGDEDTGPAPCGSYVVAVGMDSLVTLQGDSTQLAPVLKCGTSNVPGAVFTYAAVDTAVAKVTATGVVIGAGGGTTTVIVASGAPGESLPVAVYGHPAGMPVKSVPLADRPFGIAVSQSGVVYVTRYDAPYLGSFILPGLTPLVDPVVPLSARDVGFGASGDTAYVANYDQHQVTVVDVARHAAVGAIPLSLLGRPLRLLVHPGGQSLFVTTDNDSLFKVILATRAITGRLPVAPSGTNSGPAGLAYASAGTEVVVGAHDSRFTVARVDAPAVIASFDFGGIFGQVEDVASASDSDTLIAGAGGPGGLTLIDRRAETILGFVPLPTFPYAVAFSPDEKKIFVAGMKWFSIVDRATMAVDTSFQLGVELRHLAFDHYGRYVVVADEGGFVHLLR